MRMALDPVALNSVAMPFASTQLPFAAVLLSCLQSSAGAAP
jgi:hypothetical protein